MAREPWERVDIERFRRTLEALGEPDPDGVIAERLSGTDAVHEHRPAGGRRTAGRPDPEPEVGRRRPDAGAARDASRRPKRGTQDEGASRRRSPRPHPKTTISATSRHMSDVTARPAAPKTAPKDEPPDSHFELSSNGIDLQSILGNLEDAEPEEPVRPQKTTKPAPPPPSGKRKGRAHAEQESVEVDLGVDLDGIKPGAAGRRRKAGAAPEGGGAPRGRGAGRPGERHRQRVRADALQGIARHRRRRRRENR